MIRTDTNGRHTVLNLTFQTRFNSPPQPFERVAKAGNSQQDRSRFTFPRKGGTLDEHLQES